MDNTPNEKVALVTGAGNGIGRAAALKLAEVGYKLVLGDINADDNNATADLIVSKGGTAVAVTTDVSKSADVQHMVQTAVNKFGRIDYAVNNAGVYSASPIWDTSEQEFDRLMAVNLRGVFLCMKYEMPVMLQNPDFPAIVNVSSVAGLRGVVSTGAYCATKAGVIKMSECAAIDAAGKVRVSCVCPGSVRTPMLETQYIKAGEKVPEPYSFAPNICPMDRLGEPEEIAETIAFLCSDKARYINGASIVIDGAMTSYIPVAIR